MINGTFMVSRQVFAHRCFEGEPYSRREAWLWLIAQAAIKPYEATISGKKVTIRRGQLTYSIRELARVWDWKASKVQRFIARLQQADTPTDTLIDTATDTGALVITICNYDKYQARLQKTDTASDTPTDTPTDTVYKKEGNNNKGTQNARAREADVVAVAPAREASSIAPAKPALPANGWTPTGGYPDDYRSPPRRPDKPLPVLAPELPVIPPAPPARKPPDEEVLF